MKTLVIGYGNSTRSDDGAGVRVADQIACQALPNVEVRTAQQLQVDLVSDFGRYRRLVLIDAAVGGPDVSLRRIHGGLKRPMASSHHLAVTTLLNLARTLELGEPELYLCTIRGDSFHFGQTLSDPVMLRVEIAARQVTELLNQEATVHA